MFLNFKAKRFQIKMMMLNFSEVILNVILI